MELLQRLGITFVAVDKQAHFIAGFLIALITYLITEDAIIAVFFATAIGILKEIKDQIDYGGFDYKDLIATILGGCLIFLTHLF